MADSELASDALLGNSHRTDSGFAMSGARRPWAIQLGRLLYTHNPFYVASAWMIFSGLRASFPFSSNAIDVWALTLCLMGYTLLLSLTACLVIRLGKVWDDARSMLLLIVLMFLGISVTFDDILAASPEQAMWYYILGWLFAVAVSEFLLRTLRLQLGMLFRVPFHLLLALIFLYPLLLATRMKNPADPLLAWQLFAFSSIAALVFLGLIPAVRRGRAYLADNGSPWQWPWYPWILFGMLGFCVSLRSYALCVSLHFVRDSSNIFAPYFLVPLVLAAIVLLLEGGLASGSRRVVYCALLLPVTLVLLAAVGHHSDRVFQEFLALFVQRFGATPLLVTLWLVAAFYWQAAARGVAAANYPLILTLAALSLLPAGGYWRGIDPVPLAMAGAWQTAWGWRWGRSGDVVIGACLVLVSAAVAGQGTWFVGSQGILPVHALLAILLSAGYWYRDSTGRFAGRAGVALAFILASIASLDNTPVASEAPVMARMLYPLLVAALLAGYSHATGDGWSYVGAAAAATVGCFNYSNRVYVYLYLRVPGMNQLALGTVFFMLAALISLFKSGLRPTWLRRRLP